jgi:hypothetical protein
MVAIAFREARGALIDAVDNAFCTHEECEPIEPQNRSLEPGRCTWGPVSALVSALVALFVQDPVVGGAAGLRRATVLRGASAWVQEALCASLRTRANPVTRSEPRRREPHTNRSATPFLVRPSAGSEGHPHSHPVPTRRDGRHANHKSRARRSKHETRSSSSSNGRACRQSACASSPCDLCVTAALSASCERSAHVGASPPLPPRSPPKRQRTKGPWPAAEPPAPCASQGHTTALCFSRPSPVRPAPACGEARVCSYSAPKTRSRMRQQRR